MAGPLEDLTAIVRKSPRDPYASACVSGAQKKRSLFDLGRRGGRCRMRDPGPRDCPAHAEPQNAGTLQLIQRRSWRPRTGTTQNRSGAGSGVACCRVAASKGRETQRSTRPGRAASGRKPSGHNQVALLELFGLAPLRRIQDAREEVLLPGRGEPTLPSGADDDVPPLEHWRDRARQSCAPRWLTQAVLTGYTPNSRQWRHHRAVRALCR